ncbi:NADPH2 dehydrogenase [Melghiribacillus thermohalophilus]|uniref:NADPH dehydrogenase n=1 Tax=Melghiribacillus thermohalophilus TaxID=1324956 RepID=A0A4V2V2M2_9BACI|nr:NADPH dehydrogenase NamA [Melghiribacillus thermohalophilus]TCT25665.1 NADPH2 dehydrogenase [Melghiribacillus thermohalophilus]
MDSQLFSSLTIKDTTFKNRIVMSPMCMYSAESEDGHVHPFHLAHYESRAAGQAGLIIIEATAVLPEGRISSRDLGIWSDDHIDGLKKVNEGIHRHGAKSGIQLAHAGRKADVEGAIFAPSPIAFSEKYQTPQEMTREELNRTIRAFQEGARRAREANFDVIEIHGAHGYLINQFLSPLTNKRTDEYGGSRENRYQFLREIIEAVKQEWSGPLFVRISANEYDENGNTMEDFVYFALEMKKQGVDLIDCSSGAVIPARIPVYPGYQIRYAEEIKQKAGIRTGAVGLITSGLQAEEIIQNRRADLVFIGRAFLRNPYWPKQAADELEISIDGPEPYRRGWN